MADVSTRTPGSSGRAGVVTTVRSVDPRLERTRSAVMRAATDLVVDGGPSALTIDAVVERCGVAKTTIYRHWKSRDDLLAAVIGACAPRLPEPDPDADLETSLRSAMRFSARSLCNSEWARMLPAFIMLSQHEADIKAVSERIELQSNDVLAELIRDAAEQGLIARDTVIDEAIAHLQGPLLLIHLTATLPVDDQLADSIVDRFLTAFMGTSSASRSSGSAAPPRVHLR